MSVPACRLGQYMLVVLIVIVILLSVTRRAVLRNTTTIKELQVKVEQLEQASHEHNDPCEVVTFPELVKE